MKRVIFILGINFFLYSCLYNHTDHIAVLGSGYYFLGDGHESQILLDDRRTPNYKRGITIIPQEVLEYNYDKDYIIAKSFDHTVSKSFFWIVDKRIVNDSVQPLDSLSFYKSIKELKLGFYLEKRK